VVEAGATQPVYRAMRDMADDERPRERLLRHGPEILGDAELLALVLGSGLPGQNAVDLARTLLDTAGGLGGLVRADARALQRSRGMGPAKAAQIVAALELGRRALQLDPGERPLVTSPEAVFALLGGRLLAQRREQFYVLSLDTRGRLIGSAVAVQGGVNAVGARAADIFREAIVLDAVSVVLVHNHPSGDPRPSPQDVAVTEALAAAGDLLGIEVFDHVIIGHNRYLSMQREGYAFRKGKGSGRRAAE
jgi:DNA repair protein RadC